MRFTTSEEAGDPNADIGGLLVEGFVVVVEEGDEMLFQLSGDDILVQFLYEHAAFILINLDDTIYLSIYIILKHRLNSHITAPSLYYVKSSIVWIRL